MATSKEDAQMIRDAGGVSAFWWVFWLIVFAPMLIVVAIVHVNRKSRARTALALRLAEQREG